VQVLPLFTIEENHPEAERVLFGRSLYSQESSVLKAIFA
jgi:hypothetical protein